MNKLEIPYSEDILVATGLTRDQLARECRFLLAVKLFEVGRLSLGKASEFAGFPKLRFMDDLGRFGVPIINLDDDQIADELRDI